MKATAEEIKKFINDLLYYLLGVGLEGIKGKDWKGWLFFWCFLLVTIILVYLLVKVFVG